MMMDATYYFEGVMNESPEWVNQLINPDAHIWDPEDEPVLLFLNFQKQPA